MADATEPGTVEHVGGAGQLLAIKPGGPRTLKEARRKGRNIVREAKAMGEGLITRKCRGRVKLRQDSTRRVDPETNPYLRDEAGNVLTRPCKHDAIAGGTVCPSHGGKAPQVRDRANKRLLAMVEPGLIVLNELVHQKEHLPTALGAIKTILERAGGQSLGALQTGNTGDSKPTILIGIMPGGVPGQEKPKVEVTLLPQPQRSDVAEGEVAEPDADAGS